jgi:Flp pilus assembly protein TadG
MPFAYKSRNNKGQSLIALMMIIALVVMPLLAVLSFECARLILAKQELQSASDAAVLTAAATLASADDLNSLQAHKDAIEAALKIFRANTVLGRSLANTKVVASPAAFNCAVGESNVYFEFVNPITLQVEPLTSA